MKNPKVPVLAAAVTVTVAALGLWVATGRHAYTAFSVVERVESPPDPDDPLAGTGFYDDETAVYRTVRRDAFHFGLIPTPERLLDRHVLSVGSLVVPVWGLALVVFWISRRRSADPERERLDPSLPPGR